MRAVHAFCSDFDRDQPEFGWTSTEATSPAGTLTFDPFAVSAPRSMRARHPRKGDDTDWIDVLHKGFAISGDERSSRVTCTWSRPRGRRATST